MKGEPVYGASPIRRLRRAKAEMDAVRKVIYDVVAENCPMTVRQVFYQLVTHGVIDKTEGEYNSTVVRLLTEMRLNSDILWSWIADNTRWMRKTKTYSSLEQALRQTAAFYRRSVWENQDAYVEVWLEKEALAGVVVGVTGEWDVPLMVTRGYPSITYLHTAAETIEAEGKPAYLYYFGDYDPSGLDISRNVEERLRQFTPKAEIHFHRVAVTPEQITEWGLPTRPTKSSDTRSRSFQGDSVEVDAIPPDQLRELVRDCIEQHIDRDLFLVLRIAEENERELLTKMAANASNGNSSR